MAREDRTQQRHVDLAAAPQIGVGERALDAEDGPQQIARQADGQQVQGDAEEPLPITSSTRPRESWSRVA
ncbi:hypothetical protein GCM10010349_60360 [Streptomyces flavofungini]|nr:hypothetical protein GCM10010349_60360 [Streptomyces flavofungini]